MRPASVAATRGLKVALSPGAAVADRLNDPRREAASYSRRNFENDNP